MACLTFRVLFSSSLSILNPSSLFAYYYYFMSASFWAALICSQNDPRATDLNLAQVQFFLAINVSKAKHLS